MFIYLYIFIYTHFGPSDEEAVRFLHRFFARDLYSVFQVLALDLYLNTRRELELHQSVDSLRSRRVDVDDTLESAELELLTCLLVNEGRTVYSENLLLRWEWHRTAYQCISAAHCLYNLFSRLINQVVVERL